MKYDHYDNTPDSQRERIIRAQDVLFAKILHDIHFTSALEIGPGMGGFAAFCSRRKITYTGIEINERLASKLRQRGHNVLVADATRFDPGERRYDLLFLSHVLEHMDSYANVVHVLSRLTACIDDGGHVVILCPDVRWCPTQFHVDPTHSYPTSLQSLLRLLSDMGMSVVRSGHYVGRWLFGWRMLWLAHKFMPLCLLPDKTGTALDYLFLTNCFIVARPGCVGIPPG